MADDIKLRLFQFKAVHTALVDCVKTFIDPETIPDPEDPDAPPAILLFGEKGNVRKSRPSKISLYGTTLGVASLDEANIKNAGMGAGEIAIVPGGLQVWVKGRSDSSEDTCKHYCDIARAYFKNKNIIDFPGVTIKPLKSKGPKWVSINLADPRTTKVPVFYTLGYVPYSVTISKKKTYTI
ncbi:hypothetical protein [Methanobacterium ferruginis]|uniref:hypothetical protein n=1 Tax=Methanobacterium ferruginis TaxID=710191 RepID=UPI0025725A90|nr:hypothetical protein [Methanobacterium ferruginis]BDZ68597.1 hypothetical protein GCM10025860_20450 [Methanobacterium ferruginis]